MRNSNAHEDAIDAEAEEVPPEERHSIVAPILNTLARVWVIGLLLFAAGFAGVAANQYWQAQSELHRLRAEPGPDAYAIVAYRHELQRQIDLYRRDWRAEAIPAPPTRPRLLEEIDLQRLRSQRPGSPGGPGAPGPSGVVSAPQ